MTQEEAKTRIIDYVYGEMSELEIKEFETIMNSYPEIAREVDILRKIRSAINTLPAPELPQRIKSRLMVNAVKRAELHKKRREGLLTWLEKLFLSPAFASAMVIVVALGVGVHIIMLDHRLGDIERYDRIEKKIAVQDKSDAQPEQTPLSVEAEKTMIPPAQSQKLEAKQKKVPMKPQLERKVEEDTAVVSAPKKKTSYPVGKAESYPTLEMESGLPSASARSTADNIAREEKQDAMYLIRHARTAVKMGDLQGGLNLYRKAIALGLPSQQLRIVLKEAIDVAKSLGRKDIVDEFIKQLDNIK